MGKTYKDLGDNKKFFRTSGRKKEAKKFKVENFKDSYFERFETNRFKGK